ncbi:MAG: metal ABC transporter permease [Akkermansia sp.]|nr:metal ABC transporter permease [Akkermansia sp.]MBR6576868.1 metal ABC transporter permease [Akkermansia sp.]
MNEFIQFLHEPLAQRSLWACGVIGFSNGFVSALVVLRRSSLQIGTLSCALLPGIALAILIFGLFQLSILLGAVMAGLMVGLGSLFVSRTSRMDHDTALSVLHTTAFALGYIILIGLGLQQKVDDWLFGSIMSMGNADLWIAYCIGAIAVLSITALQRPLLIALFDPRAAATMGIPTRALNYGIFALIILVLVSSLQAVGAFLTLGLLVAPAATMYLLTDRAAWLFWGGGLIGGLGAIAAFFLSFPLGWHLGATIIVVLGTLFLLAYIFSPRYGLLRHRKK